MTKTAVAGTAFAIMLVLLAVAFGYFVLVQNLEQATSPSTAPDEASEAHPSFLYGRITTDDGKTYEGRLRWGKNQEAFWGDYFNGLKEENTWSKYVPTEQLLKEPTPIEIFGIEIMKRQNPIDVSRSFMARFGDIARLEMATMRVILKSGTVVGINYNTASDFGDGVRVWDSKQGVVDLDYSRIKTIQFLSAPGEGAVPHRLYGTVHTRQGEFTGFVQWNQNDALGTDELNGLASDGSVRFDTIRSIARNSADSSRVKLLDGREIVLSGTQETGQDNLGIYVDDARYGRVLIPWSTFERVDFTPGGSGPAYDDFPAGRPLMGSIATHRGRRFVGRLVYDLDESETTDTLDAPLNGVTYNIPFSMIASIVIPARGERAKVTLHNGEQLQLDRAGDLDDGKIGMLVFVDSNSRPEYVRTDEIEQIDFGRP